MFEVGANGFWVVGVIVGLLRVVVGNGLVVAIVGFAI